MNKKMYKLEQAKALIATGKPLIIAADEQVLRKLPAGNWIGGTIPYFIGESGGVFSQEMAYVTEIPSQATSANIEVYGDKSIHEIYKRAPEHGFSFVIIPGFSQTHLTFALNAPMFPNFAANPLIGWISGFNLADLGKITAKVFDGRTAKAIENGAVVFYVTLPENLVANLEIVNIFDQGSGDTITFSADGFSTKEAIINGKPTRFADYLSSKNIDTKLPLVANMCGAMINTSFQSVDKETGVVNFYAPVFKDIEYKIGQPVKDYVAAFLSRLPKGIDDQLFFSCNCILNYLYAELEGKKTGCATGPITFGEIAYQLLNQTMSYMTIDKN